VTKIQIIAEIGSVHDGSLGNALRLIDAAAEAGADAVKFQTHIAEAESLPDAPSPGYFSDEPRIAYFKRTGFAPEQWKKLARHAESAKVTFLSSPFSLEAVDLLEDVGVKAYKVPSGEVTNLPLLERIAATRKPAILSSGMSDWKELDRAVAILKPACDLTVLQCSSAYPCTPEQVGLNVLGEMKARYGTAVGLSDHTLGLAAAVAAAALGATVVEKHFTFSRLMYGSDAKHSMEPADFRAFCQALHEVWRMQASPIDKDDVRPYAEMKRIFQKSVVTARALKAGTVLARDMLAFKKPGDGIPASSYRTLLGKTVRKDLRADHKLATEDLA
jgi:N,N'-diacetyllegionaminate synthase